MVKLYNSMKKDFYYVLLLVCLLLFPIKMRAQQKKTSTANKQYVTIAFPYDPTAMQRKVPIYSDIRGVEKKLARYIYVMGVYTIQPIKESNQYFKLFDLDGKYLGYIHTDYFNYIYKPEVPKDLNMVHVEGGTFLMGDNTDPEASPVHSVTLSDFDIMRYEITIEQWRSIMGVKASKKVSSYEDYQRQVRAAGATTRISWNDIQEFIKILNKLSGKQYRLPTEAEWEYAARGGKYSKGYQFSGSDNLTKVAICKSNSKPADESLGYCRHAVGLLAPNELGLYDMSGNMWELCADAFGYYSDEPQTNPKVTTNDREAIRVMRGGSFCDELSYCKTTKRYRCYPYLPYDTYSFRLVLDCADKSHKTQSPIVEENHYVRRDPMGNGFIRVATKNGEYASGYSYGVIDSLGKVVLPCEYALIREYSDGAFYVGKDKAGVVDLYGNWLIPMNYETIGPLSSDGYFWGRIDGKLTLRKIGQDNAVVDAVYDKVFVQQDNSVDNEVLFISELVPSPTTEIYKVYKDNKVGAIGQAINIPVIFDEIGNVQKGNYTWAKKDNKYCVINNNGLVNNIEFDEVMCYSGSEMTVLNISTNKFNSFKYYVRKDGYWGIMNNDSKMLVEPIFNSISNYSEELAVVCKDKKYGYINTKGDVAIQCFFLSASDFSEGLAAVTIEGKKGYAFIDKQGIVVIKPISCDSVGYFKNGKCSITKGNKTYFINTNGKKIKD